MFLHRLLLVGLGAGLGLVFPVFCAIAEAPPLGSNLLADPGFEASLESTPWQVLSGAADDMLCPDKKCGGCYRHAGNGVLRFDARQTDDIWIIQQPVTLPPADSYELTFFLAGCNGAATGSISVSLGASPEQTLVLDPQEETGEYRRYRFVFDSIEANEGEGEAGGALVISNPSLSGADISIDDIRLVARTEVDTCTVDPALVGEWKGTKCGNVQTETWEFFEDGTFKVEADSKDSRDDYYSGTYCVDTSQSPARMVLLMEQRCSSDDVPPAPDEFGACPHESGQDCELQFCTAAAEAWYGLYQIEEGVLTLRVEECQPANLQNASKFRPTNTYLNFGTTDCGILDSCETPVEGESEGETGIATNITGRWERYACNYPGDVGDVWEFSMNGHFQRGRFLPFDQFDDAVVITNGTYRIDTNANPDEVLLENVQHCIYLLNGIGLQFYICGIPTQVLGAYKADENSLVLDLHGRFPESHQYDQSGDYCEGEVSLEGLEGFEQQAAIVAQGMEGFATGDTDQSGSLSTEEALAIGVGELRFFLLDVNEDDALSAAELLMVAGPDSPRHSADTNLDGAFSLAELLRSIQMYNSGGYSCAPLADSEDGYLPQPFEGKGADPGCPAHASDYTPADGVISLSELLRAIQLFNTGPYLRCVEGGEDGFCSAD